MSNDVTQLLTASKAHHLAYLQEDRKAPNADYAKCEAEVAQALSLREQADALDPDHTAAIWHDDAVRWPHARLLAFYRKYSSIP